jgi:hypothetical protein
MFHVGKVHSMNDSCKDAVHMAVKYIESMHGEAMAEIRSRSASYATVAMLFMCR